MEVQRAKPKSKEPEALSFPDVPAFDPFDVVTRAVKSVDAAVRESGDAAAGPSAVAAEPSNVAAESPAFGAAEVPPIDLDDHAALPAIRALLRQTAAASAPSTLAEDARSAFTPQSLYGDALSSPVMPVADATSEATPIKYPSIELRLSALDAIVASGAGHASESERPADAFGAVSPHADVVLRPWTKETGALPVSEAESEADLVFPLVKTDPSPPPRLGPELVRTLATEALQSPAADFSTELEFARHSDAVDVRLSNDDDVVPRPATTWTSSPAVPGTESALAPATELAPPAVSPDFSLCVAAASPPPYESVASSPPQEHRAAVAPETEAHELAMKLMDLSVAVAAASPSPYGSVASLPAQEHAVVAAPRSEPERVTAVSSFPVVATDDLVLPAPMSAVLSSVPDDAPTSVATPVRAGDAVAAVPAASQMDAAVAAMSTASAIEAVQAAPVEAVPASTAAEATDRVAEAAVRAQAAAWAEAAQRLMSIDEATRRRLQSATVEERPLEDDPHAHQLYAGSLFYRLVAAYREAELQLHRARQELENAKARFDALCTGCWTMTPAQAGGEAQCVDGVRLKETIDYKVAKLNEDGMKLLREHFDVLKKSSEEGVISTQYASRSARLSVESHMASCLADSWFYAIRKESPVVAVPRGSQPLFARQSINELAHLIDVLFFFQRQQSVQSKLAEESSSSDGSSVAPPGLKTFYADVQLWARQLVSVQLRCASTDDHGVLLSHLARTPNVHLWAADLLQFPAECEVEHFVEMLSLLLKPVVRRPRDDRPDPKEAPEMNDWVVLDRDSSGRGPPEVFLLYEDDFVALLEQFPFGALFRRLFSERPVHEAFRLANYFLETFTSSLFVFRRFPHFVKVLGKTMVTLLQGGAHVFAGLQSDERSPQYQLQLDQLVVKAVGALLARPGAGLWQFVAESPLHAVSFDAAWLLAATLFAPESAVPAVPDPRSLSGWNAVVIAKPTLREAFIRTVSSSTEGLFLMFSLAKLAGKWGGELGQVVLGELFLLAVAAPASLQAEEAALFRPARDMIDAVCLQHPSLFSHVIGLLAPHSAAHGSHLHKLLVGLPLHMWQPSAPDLSFVRGLLLQPLGGHEEKLGRFILDHLDWSAAGPGVEPFLGWEFHQRSTLMLLEVYLHHLRAVNDASVFAAGRLRKLLDEFTRWLWSRVIVAQHRSDGQSGIEPLDFHGPLLAPARNACPLDSWTVQSPPFDGLASYVVLAVSNVGQQPLSPKALHLLRSVLDAAEFVAALHLLYELVPAAVDADAPAPASPGASFASLVSALMREERPSSRGGLFSGLFSSAPSGGRASPTAQMLGALAVAQVSNASTPARSSTLVLFWFAAILHLDSWYQDSDCCFVADNVLRFGVDLPIFPAVQAALKKYIDAPAKSRGPGLLAHLKATAREQAKTQPWLLFATLLLETEIESPHRKTYADVVCASPSISPKALETERRRRNAPSPLDLVIHRWAIGALELDVEHPLLPLYFQGFFWLYFARRDSTVHGTIFVSHAKSAANNLRQRLLTRLDALIKFHVAAAERSPGMPSSSSTLASLYNALSLWLQAPAPANLFAAAAAGTCPAALWPQLLYSLRDGDAGAQLHDSLWTNMLDRASVQELLSKSGRPWRERFLATEQHVRRLKAKADEVLRLAQRQRTTVAVDDAQCLPPPPLAAPRTPLEPFPLDHAALPKLDAVIAAELPLLIGAAKAFEQRLGVHAMLEKTILEAIPQLYRNEPKSIPKEKRCRPDCGAPAVIVLQCTEPRTIPACAQHLAETRRRLLELVDGVDFPRDLVVLAVRIAKTVELMVHAATVAPSVTLSSAGSRLFYCLVADYIAATQAYAPTRAFLASTITSLAAAFIAPAPQEMFALLRTIAVSLPDRVPLLAPYFRPALDPVNFVDMLKLVLAGRSGLPVPMQLLRCFDVGQWLAARPPASLTDALLALIVPFVLSPPGKTEPESTAEPKAGPTAFLAEAFKAVVQHGFPANLGHVLRLLTADPARTAFTRPAALWQSVSDLYFERQLSTNAVCDAVDVLAAFAWAVRLGLQKEGRTLYDWQPYAASFLKLMSRLLQSACLYPQSAAVASLYAISDESLGWQCCAKLFEPWLAPSLPPSYTVASSDKPVETPAWLPQQSAEASAVLSTFVDVVLRLQAVFPATVRYVWRFLHAFYTAPLLAPHHVQLLLCGQFGRLPWNQLQASDVFLVEMFYTLERISDASEPPTSPHLALMTTIFCAVTWPSPEAASAELLAALYRVLLRLLAMLPLPLPEVLQGQLKSAGFYPWLRVADDTVRSLLSEEGLYVRFAPAGRPRSSTTPPPERGASLQPSPSIPARRPTLLGRLWGQPSSAAVAAAVPVLVDAEGAAIGTRLVAVLTLASAVVGREALTEYPGDLRALIGRLACFMQLLVQCFAFYGLEASNDASRTLLRQAFDLVARLLAAYPAVVTPNHHTDLVFLLQELLDVANCATVAPRQLLEHIWSPAFAPVALQFLDASCRRVLSPSKLAQLLEGTIDCYFQANTGWDPVCAAAALPELDEDTFVKACVDQGCVYVLHVWCLQWPMRHEVPRDARMVDPILSWLKTVNVSAPDLAGREEKLLLLASLAYRLLWTSLQQPNTSRVQQLLEVSNLLLKFAEDQKSSRLLRAIGLGEKSAMPVPFRLCCRALATFAVCQIRSDDSIRLRPEPYVVTRGSERLLKELATLPPEYQSVQTVVQFAQGWLQDSGRTLADCGTLVFHLTSRLFPDNHNCFARLS